MGINVAVELAVAEHDVRHAIVRLVEESRDPIGWGGYLFNDFLQLLDHATRFDNRLLVI